MGKRPLRTRLGLRVLTPLLRMRRNLYYRCAGGEDRPVFHDVDAVCPELKRIDQNFDVIRGELEAVLGDRKRFPRYHEVDFTQQSISEGEDDWRVFFLHMTHPEVPIANAKLCPRTAEVVRGIPGILTAFFSILDAGKSIPPHEGPSPTYLRYHTAFRVPRDKPPSIRVRDRVYTWKEGESLLFDDSWEHEVYNESSDVRVVLIVDVLRPVPLPVRAFGAVVLWLNSLIIGEADWSTVEERMRVRQA